MDVSFPCSKEPQECVGKESFRTVCILVQVQEEARRIQQSAPERQEGTSAKSNSATSNKARLGASVCLIASSLLQPEHTALELVGSIEIGRARDGECVHNPAK